MLLGFLKKLNNKISNDKDEIKIKEPVINFDDYLIIVKTEVFVTKTKSLHHEYMVALCYLLDGSYVNKYPRLYFNQIKHRKSENDIKFSFNVTGDVKNLKMFFEHEFELPAAKIDSLLIESDACDMSSVSLLI